MTCRRSPAVVAGLLGVATVGSPSRALAEGSAAPLDVLSRISLSSIDPETAVSLGVSFAGGVLVEQVSPLLLPVAIAGLLVLMTVCLASCDHRVAQSRKATPLAR